MTAPVEKPSFEFGVLGPVAFRRDGQHLRIAAVPRRLLGLLLAHGDQYVAADVIVEEMWPGDPSIRGRPRLQVNVSRLRQLLDDADRITYRTGYAIRLQPDELDSVVFERLIAESAQAAARGDPSTARACLRDAVSLWRGAAYDGLLDMPSVARTAARLEHLRLDAIEQAIQLDLDAGQHSAVIAELSILIPQHPYRERMRGQHMLALYRSGRQADALDAYRQTYQVLSDDLGVEPVSELQALHQHILAGDPSLDGRSREAVASHYQAPELVRPQLLPRPVANFIGRSEQLASLDANARGDHSTGPAGILSVITGSAGMGKTALAVHWAHRVADKFPDGQLYVNLRGYDAHPASLIPADALRGFLVALGEQTQHLPDDTDALANLYRTRVAHRRMLVVLDNARDAAQIRVLLPGSPQAAVLVTSRSQLAGLVATEGAHLVSLDVFNRYEARDLMIQRLGADRVYAESEAAGKIAACCARLPLALAIATAHAVTQPTTPLAAIAAELSDARTVLDILRLDDAVDIAAVFSWSYDTLSADAAMIFRALGAHPVPEVSLDAIASLAGVPPARARVLLAELTRANLITEYACQRFTMHDLLLAYAREMRRGAGAEAESRRAISRLLDHYLHSALLAAVLFQPGRRPLAVIPAGAGVTIAVLTDQQDALAWLQAEHQALIAVTLQAGEQGLDMHVWQLAWCLSEYLNFQGRWNDSIRVQHAALDAAARLGNREAMAFSRRGFGHALLEADRYVEAQAQLRMAQRLFSDNNDRQGEALVLQMMADLRVRQGRHHEALALFDRALHVYEDVGNILGRAQALNNVGMQYVRLGRHAEALASCTEALVVFVGKGEVHGISAVHDTLGRAYYGQGNLGSAVEHFEHALKLNRQLGERYFESETLTRLGDAYNAQGDRDAAFQVWELARDILEHLNHPDASALGTKLDDLRNWPARPGAAPPAR